MQRAAFSAPVLTGSLREGFLIGSIWRFWRESLSLVVHLRRDGGYIA